MRVCCIADLHGHVPADVPPCDLLLIAGDLGPDDPREGAAWLRQLFVPWLERQPAAEVAAIAGNHDYMALRRPELLREVAAWRYLENDAAIVAGLRVAGSSWSLTFGIWPMQAPEEELEDMWQSIPDDTEVVLVHGPPYGYCDLTARGVHGGSRTLLRRLLELPRLRLVCTGHIHEGYGQAVLPTGALVVNASLVDVALRPVNAPILVDL
jgi:Icc-related predicted phosphoesterase